MSGGYVIVSAMATLTRVGSIGIATAPGGGFMVVSDDGQVMVLADNVEVSDEVFTHLEAPHPMSEQERAAATARLDAYLSRRRGQMPGQRHAVD